MIDEINTPIIGDEKNKLLSDFANDEVPSIVQPQVVAEPVAIPIVQQPMQQSTQQPMQQSTQQPMQQLLPPMIDASELVVGEATDGDGVTKLFEEGDSEEVESGEKVIVCSKNFYKIKLVSMEPEKVLAMHKAGEFTYSQDKTSHWIKTNMVIEFENSDYKLSLPNIRWFLNEESKRYEPSITLIKTTAKYGSVFTATTSKLYYKFCNAFEQVKGVFGLKSFVEALIGKEAKLYIYEGDYNGKGYQRMEILTFKK